MMENFKKMIWSQWNEEAGILLTRLSGMISAENVQAWVEGFNTSAALIPAGTKFMLFSDLHGFKATDIGAHKMMREVIPRFLASHGVYPAYARLFPEQHVQVSSELDRVCIRCAHVHHDETKINKYHNELSNETEDFFTSEEDGWRWLVS